MPEIGRDTILEAKRKQLQGDIGDWMVEHGIPVVGEKITFTASIVEGIASPLNVTVKRVQLSERIVRTTITDGEWSQVLAVVNGPKQRSLLEFLRNGPDQQRTQSSVYGLEMLGGAEFKDQNKIQANKTLKNAGLPFRIRILPEQDKEPGDKYIALVVIESLVES